MSNLETYTHPSGLQFYVDHLAHANTTGVSIFVGVGNANERETEGGLNHIIEHGTHLGSPIFPTEAEAAEYCDMHMFWANAEAGYTRTLYQADGPDLESIFHYFGQIVARPLLDSQRLSDHLGVVRREAKAHLDDLDYVIARMRDRQLFNDPFGRPIIGLSNKLHFAPEEIIDFHKRHYALGNMAVVAAGAATLEEVTTLAQRYLIDSPLAENQLGDVFRPTAETRPAGAFGLLRESSPNAVISVSHPLPAGLRDAYSDNPTAYVIASRILGEEIYHIIREERQLAYDAGYGIRVYNHPDAWWAGTDVNCDPERVGEVLQVFGEVMGRGVDSFGNNKKQAKINAMIGAVLRSMNDQDSRLDSMITRLERYKIPLDMDDVAARYRNVSLREVDTALGQLLSAYQQIERTIFITGNNTAVRGLDHVKVDL